MRGDKLPTRVLQYVGLALVVSAAIAYIVTGQAASVPIVGAGLTLAVGGGLIEGRGPPSS